MLQALVHIAATLGMRGELHDHPRRRALHIEVGVEQLVRQRVEEACGHLPEQFQRGLRLALGQAQADGGQILRCTRVGRFDDLQHVRIKALTGAAVQRQCGHWRRLRFLLRLVALPEVGRVDTLHTGEGLHFLVLRKQRYEGDVAPLEHMAQVLQQRKRRALHQRDRFLGAQVGLGRKTLCRHFHQAHQLGRLAHTHHLQRTLDLVQVLLGHADTGGVDRLQVRYLGRFHIPAVTKQCLDRGFQ